MSISEEVEIEYIVNSVELVAVKFIQRLYCLRALLVLNSACWTMRSISSADGSVY